MHEHHHLSGSLHFHMLSLIADGNGKGVEWSGEVIKLLSQVRPTWVRELTQLFIYSVTLG